MARLIDSLAAGQTWMKFVIAYSTNVTGSDADGVGEGFLEPRWAGGATRHPLLESALLAFSYVARHVKDGRPKFGLEPRRTTDDDGWPPPPATVDPELADGWWVLAERVHANAPKARLYAAAFLRGGPERARYGRAAADAYMAAADEATRQAETVEYLTSALRLSRAVSDSARVAAAHTGLLDFVNDELANQSGLGFAIQALELAAHERAARGTVEALAERVCAATPQLQIADRAFKLRLQLAAEPDKEAIWRERVQRHRSEALAEDLPAVRSVKLRHALQVAQASGHTDLRDQVAADLQECAQLDLGMIRFSATSALYDETIDELIEAMIGGDSWKAALVRFAQFGPLSGTETANRRIIEERHASSPLLALFPTHLIGPDNLPSYSGVDPEDRFEVDLVRWEAELVSSYLPPLAEALHQVPDRHGLPPLTELHEFLASWPGLDAPTTDVLAVALHRFWSGDSDGATYSALPQIEGQIRRLIMARNVGIYRAQKDKTPGQTLGLGAMLPLLPQTHDMSTDWLRYYAAALVHVAGLNLRNHLMHGFRGLQSAEVATLTIHLLLHIGTLQPAADGPEEPPGD